MNANDQVQLEIVSRGPTKCAGSPDKWDAAMWLASVIGKPSGVKRVDVSHSEMRVYVHFEDETVLVFALQGVIANNFYKFWRKA